jgi:hypothetical protein
MLTTPRAFNERRTLHVDIQNLSRRSLRRHRSTTHPTATQSGAFRGGCDTDTGEGRIRNTRIRQEGTRNLVSAALKAGVRRLISQPGIYNVAQPNSYATTTKAATELGWNADFRIED